MRQADTVGAMTTEPQPQGAALYGLIVDEIYAEMGRQRLGQVALAERLHQSQPWVNRRLKGHTDITVPELEAIADALGVTMPDLIQRAVTRSGTDTGWLSDQPAQRRTLRTILALGKHKRTRLRTEVALHAHPHNHGPYRLRLVPDLPEQLTLPYPRNGADLIGVAQ
jgi:transcriptional regulator with XRE-family HTH domain